MKLGGALGALVLGALARRFGPLAFDYEDNDPDRTSRLRTYFGASLEPVLRNRIVLDFGCGRGADVVAMARAGAARATTRRANPNAIERFAKAAIRSSRSTPSNISATRTRCSPR